ncbi:MAG: hypothetical protein DCF16_10825 [Alphaproteobacteria bacterium]|nr:MAG: hypothetical protein DCF16_10825 [Alphaproteobacteria bacterium]
MQEGYSLDNAHGGARTVSSWVEGEPKPSFWFGLKVEGAPIAIESWRCSRCGFIEQYAKG